MKKKPAKPSLQPTGRNPSGIRNLSSEPLNIPDILAALTILTTGIIIYSNSFSCSFHLDDDPNIVYNDKIRDWRNFQAIWEGHRTRFFTFLTFAANYHFGGYRVWGYHFVNLLIHLINALLVWQLARRIFETPALKHHPLASRRNLLALAIGLMFVAHPLATQSVTYIVQRLASLAALFYFASILLYINARLELSAKKYLFFGGSFITLILALLSKENAYTLPFAIFLFELCLFREGPFRLNLRNYRLVAALLLLGGFMIYLFSFYGMSVLKPLAADATTDYRKITPLNYLLTQFTVIPKYILLLLLPVQQNLDYDQPMAGSFFRADVILGFLFILGLIGYAFFIFNKNRLLSLGILFFFLTLSIESGFIPISDLIFEHRTYLPSFGFFLAAGAILVTFLRKRTLQIAFLSLITLLFSTLTYSRNKIWINDEILWTDVIKKSPEKIRPYNCRGTFYYFNNRQSEAIADYTRAVELGPEFIEAYYNRGNAYLKNNQYPEAIRDYDRVAAIKPEMTETYVNRSSAYLKSKNFAGALNDFKTSLRLNEKNTDGIYRRIKGILAENSSSLRDEDYEELIRLMPQDDELYFSRGLLLRDQNKPEQALPFLNKAISLNSGRSEYFFSRGCVMQNMLRNKEAIADFSKAISLKGDYIECYVNRANVLRDMKMRSEALADYRKAEAINPDFEMIYNNRGILYLNEGETEKAIIDFSKAISIKPNYGNAYYNRGLARYRLGDKNQACADWSQAAAVGHPGAGEQLKQACN